MQSVLPGNLNSTLLDQYNGPSNPALIRPFGTRQCFKCDLSPPCWIHIFLELSLHLCCLSQLNTMEQKSAIGGAGPALLCVLWVQVGIAVPLVTLRGVVASKKNNKWRWDFIWSALALVTAVTAACFVTKSVFVGLGNHFLDLTLDDDMAVLRWNYYAIYIGVISIAFSKFSVTALMLDVQQGTQYKVGRIFLWSIAAIFTVTSLLEIFFTAFQCRPIDHVWKLTSSGKCPYEKEARAISYVHASKSMKVSKSQASRTYKHCSVRRIDRRSSRAVPYLYCVELTDLDAGEGRFLPPHDGWLGAGCCIICSLQPPACHI